MRDNRRPVHAPGNFGVALRSAGGGDARGRRRLLRALGILALFAVTPLSLSAGASGGGSPGPGPVARGAVSTDSLTIARLQYEGGGDWYANPSSLPNLLAEVRARTGLVVSQREAVVRPLDPNLREYPYLYLTGHGDVRFSPAERSALRGYLEGGGFLHADDNYGLDESFREEVAALFPERELVELPPDHPVFHTLYDFPEGLPKVHEHDGARPQALGIFHEGRLVLFYSYESDLGDGWEDADVHQDAPEVRESALRMGVNLFLYALTGAAGTSAGGGA